MTILNDLNALLVEHAELPAAVNGRLLAQDLRELVKKWEKEEETAEFELHVDGEFQAGASGPFEMAIQEIMHYKREYIEDGVATIYRVTREEVKS